MYLYTILQKVGREADIHSRDFFSIRTDTLVFGNSESGI